MNCISRAVVRLLYLLALLAGGLSAFGQLNLSLDQAVGLALKANYDIEIAEVNAAIAANNNFAGATGQLPVVSAVVGNTAGVSGLNQHFFDGTEITRFPAFSNNLTAGVALSWTVFDGWRMYAIKDRLNATEAMGRLAYENTLRTTTFEVCMAYYGLVRLKNQQQALRETIGFFEERERLAKARFETGVAAKSEWLLAQTDLNEQRAALLQLQNTVNQTYSTLIELLGLPPGQTDTFIPTDSIPLPIASSLAFHSLMDSFQTRNPLWLSTQQAFAVALAQRKEAASRRLPQLAVNSALTGQNVNSSGGQFLLNQNAGLSAGFTLSVPIFDGQVANHQIRTAEKNLELRQLEAARLINEVKLQFIRLDDELNNALQQIAIEAITLELAKENAGIAQERYRRAQATALELRQTQLAYVEAQTRLMNARYAACVADLQFRLLAGRPIR